MTQKPRFSMEQRDSPFNEPLLPGREGALESDLESAASSLNQSLADLVAEQRRLETPTVLIVDDEPAIGEAIARSLHRHGIEASFIDDPLDVRAYFSVRPPEVVFLDVHMPGIKGLELLEDITLDYPDTIVIVGTGAPTVELTIRALRAGASDFLVKPFKVEELVAAISRGLARRKGSVKQRLIQVTLERTVLERSRSLVDLTFQLTTRNRDIARAYGELLERLGRASQWRDDETGLHIQRIGQFSEKIAESLGLSPAERQIVRDASPMHDIGKIGVPDSILLKPGRLTPVEFEAMKAHTLIGGHLLSGSDVPVIKASEEIALSHHEWWNGGGYPKSLKGEIIPLYGRIVAIADVYDALVHDRSYKKAVPIDETISQMRARRGSQFDPQVFDAFLGVAGEFPCIEARLALESPSADEPHQSHLLRREDILKRLRAG